MGSVRRLLLVVAAAVVLLMAVVFVLDRVFTSPEHREFRRQFSLVKPGMTRVEVVALLGEPYGEGTEFRLSQRKGFESEYKRAEASGSKYYLFWNKEIELTFAIGFDESGRVRMTSVGGT
jgi:hypothetical protein